MEQGLSLPGHQTEPQGEGTSVERFSMLHSPQMGARVSAVAFDPFNSDGAKLPGDFGVSGVSGSGRMPYISTVDTK